MANPIPDVAVTSAIYVDINTITSITAGLAVDIQNKSNSVMILQISATIPSATSAAGYYILPNKIQQIPVGAAKLWVRSASQDGKVMVRAT